MEFAGSHAMNCIFFPQTAAPQTFPITLAKPPLWIWRSNAQPQNRLRVCVILV